MLVAAWMDFQGWHFGIRTITSGGRRTALFMTNDQGVYVTEPAAPSTSKLRVVETPDHNEQENR